MAKLWDSGDPLRDALDRDRFLIAAHKGSRTVAATPNRRTVYLAGIPEPFPAPLIKTGDGWRFDGKAGSEELTARQIRRNEKAVSELCHRFLEAELSYVDGAYGGKPAFAQRIRSTPGQHDGLFWSGDAGEEESPLGPVFAAAAYGEQPAGAELRPLFGYFFRILPSKERTDPRSRGEFTLIAWPAEYGVTGSRSFVIRQSGEQYQKDLGPNGGVQAGSVTTVALSNGWRRVGNPVTARTRKD
jgi:hypothetical protein